MTVKYNLAAFSMARNSPSWPSHHMVVGLTSSVSSVAARLREAQISVILTTCTVAQLWALRNTIRQTFLLGNSRFGPTKKWQYCLTCKVSGIAARLGEAQLVLF